MIISVKNLKENKRNSWFPLLDISRKRGNYADNVWNYRRKCDRTDLGLVNIEFKILKRKYINIYMILGDKIEECYLRKLGNDWIVQGE
jgi:hypothetical protein